MSKRITPARVLRIAVFIVSPPETNQSASSTRLVKLERPWWRKMPACLRLPPTVRDESHFRVCQRRFHPFNVYTEQKRRGKFNYTHNSP
jgi:hypothetical protein